MTDRKLLSLASVLAPAGFCLAVIAAIFLPVYTDEVGWRLQERAGLDGVDKQFSVLCGPTTLARPPLWMMPARFYSAFFNTQFPDPLYTRLSGILYALVWAALFGLLAGRIAADAPRRKLILALGFGLMGIGLTPLLLAWSRPEQPILISLTAAILVSAYGWQGSRRATLGRAVAATGLVLALAAVALSYHLKSVFLVPAFAACLVHASHGRSSRWPRGVGVVALCVLAVQGAVYWIERLDCPGDHSYLQSQNLGAKLLSARSLGEAGEVLMAMAVNVNPFPYLGRTAPRPDTMASWLAQLQVNAGTTKIWWVLIGFVWVLAAMFALDTLVRAIRKSISARRLEPRLTIAAALVLAVLGWSATQVIQNDYEASFVVPLLMLAIVLALSCDVAKSDLLEAARVLAQGLAVATFVSMAAVGAIYGPSLGRALGERGYIAAQPSSISPFGYEALRSRIVRVAALCGIDPERSRNLVVDDLTYYAFMRSPLPDHVVGLWTPELPVEDRSAYLRERGSDGIIASCGKLPPQLRQGAHSEGGTCCIAPSWR